MYDRVGGAGMGMEGWARTEQKKKKNLPSFRLREGGEEYI